MEETQTEIRNEENKSQNDKAKNENDIVELLAQQIEYEKIEFLNSENIEFYGTMEQRQQMFEDWSKYIGEIQNPKNTAVNPFFKRAGSSEGSLYAPLDEVLNNTRPILSKYGLGILQSPTYKQGSVSVKTIITHKSGGLMNFPSLTIPISKNDAQGIIAGVTYARRGSINPILATHGEVDDDGNSISDNKDTKTKLETSNKNQEQPKKLDGVAKIIDDIDKLAKSLTAKGVDKKLIKETTKENNIINGEGVANYNKITDVKVAQKVLDALNKLEVPKQEAENTKTEEQVSTKEDK